MSVMCGIISVATTRPVFALLQPYLHCEIISLLVSTAARRHTNRFCNLANIVSWLHRAAVATGVPADEYAARSLRIGGACALYHVFGDIDLFRRYGRWTSSAFHVYLWEARPSTKLVARGMVKDAQPLMASQGLGTASTRRGVSFMV